MSQVYRRTHMGIILLIQRYVNVLNGRCSSTSAPPRVNRRDVCQGDSPSALADELWAFNMQGHVP